MEKTTGEDNLSQLTTEGIYKLRPPDRIGPGKKPQVQISYPEPGKTRGQMPFVIPQEELDALDSIAPRGQRSETVRQAVIDLAMRLGLVQKSPARIQVEHTAQLLHRDPDELADELGVDGPMFRPTLEALAESGNLYTRKGDLSMARAIRWAIKVYLAENT